MGIYVKKTRITVNDPRIIINNNSMSKKKFSFDIVTDEDGKVRLENVQHKKVAPELADALNKVIGEVVRGYNLTQKVRRIDRMFTNRDETRRLIALGLNPKTRDLTLVHVPGKRGWCYLKEGYRTVEELRLCNGRSPRIERRWSRSLLDQMLMKPDEIRGKWYFEREIEKSISEIEARINDGTFNDEFLKHKR